MGIHLENNPGPCSVGSQLVGLWIRGLFWELKEYHYHFHWKITVANLIFHIEHLFLFPYFFHLGKCICCCYLPRILMACVFSLISFSIHCERCWNGPFGRLLRFISTKFIGTRASGTSFWTCTAHKLWFWIQSSSLVIRVYYCKSGTFDSVVGFKFAEFQLSFLALIVYNSFEEKMVRF